MLAESFMEMHQLRLMVYDAAWKYDQGRDIRAEAYGQDFRRHPVIPTLPIAAWRSTAALGFATLFDREILERPAQHDDHRRSESRF